ncbi:MAG: hypothetical protein Q8Q13_03365 [bacterium]|nr:hypothetical protein [bacterium]
MQWIRAHRYTVALIAAAVLVVTGGMMAKNNTGTGIERGGVENISVEYPYYAPPAAEPARPTESARGNPLNPARDAGAPPRAWSFTPAMPKPEASAVSIIPRPAVKVPTKEPDTAQTGPLFEPYALFVRALSFAAPAADSRRPEQKALFEYGNALGSVITGFENAHTDVVQILKTFFDSRVDPAKAAGIPEIAEAYAQLTAGSARTVPVSGAEAAANLRKIADAYAQLSATVANMNNVPPEAEMLNAGLANVYAGAAQGLVRLSKTENETQLLDAVNAYNVNADEFIKNYVALVQLFSAYEVKFSGNDAGSVFSFSSNGGL